MNGKLRWILRIVIAVIFVIGGIVYLTQQEWLFACLFVAVGLVFGYRAIKDKKQEN